MTVQTLPGVIISDGTSTGPITNPVITPTPFFILLEDGFYILQEDNVGKFEIE